MNAVDYRMARRAVLRDLQRGRVSLYDVCDAHPELLRAARYVGEAAPDSCPICEKDDLRLVLYTYGKGKRDAGRVRRRTELRELRDSSDEFSCYVVEVCTGCNWNHLVRSFVSGRAHAV